MIFSADAIHRAQSAHRSLSVLLLLRPDSDYNDDKELNSVVVTICNHCHRVLLFLLVASSALAGWPFGRPTWALGTPENRSDDSKLLELFIHLPRPASDPSVLCLIEKSTMDIVIIDGQAQTRKIVILHSVSTSTSTEIERHPRV